MTAALQGGEWSAARPGSTLLQEKTMYPFYRRLGRSQGRFGRAENLIPTGIRSRTVQPVAQSLYRLSYPAHLSYSKRTTIYTEDIRRHKATRNSYKCNLLAPLSTRRVRNKNTNCMPSSIHRSL